MHAWHKGLLHRTIPTIIATWEPKWGNCNQRARHLRINTELAKKPKDLLECVAHGELHLRGFAGSVGSNYPP